MQSSEWIVLVLLNFLSTILIDLPKFWYDKMKLLDAHIKFTYKKRETYTNVYNSSYLIAMVATDSRLAYSSWDAARVCKYSHGPELVYSMLGLDTHADISCAGADAHIVSKVEGRTCAVHPFNESYKAMTGIEVVNVLFKYEDTDGEQYILEVNQCLNFTETMKHSILCTNQARHAELQINDIPRVLDSLSSQDIRINGSDTIIQIEMNGPIPFIPVPKPNS